MDITRAHVVEAAFVNTYATADRPHPGREFERYELVMHHRAERPEIGARRMGRRLGIPYGRIQAWLNGSKPTGYDSFQTARDRGWFDLSWDSERFTALNTLVAWNLSGGALSERYAPMWATEQETHDRVEDALDALGVGHETVQRDDDLRRGPEVRPADDAVLVGRMLAALGVPTGAKATQRFGLPAYLDRAPRDVRQTFASVYLLNRASPRAPRVNSYEMRLREERPAYYLGQLAALFQSLTEGEVSYTGDYVIYFDSEAAEELVGSGTASAR